MEFIYNYGLFLAKTATIVIAFSFLFATIHNLKAKYKGSKKTICINNLNEQLEEIELEIEHHILSKEDIKKKEKERKKQEKNLRKQKEKIEEKKRIFVLHFDGDVRAQEVEFLREEITAILTVAKTKDEVLLILESCGGIVHDYGLGASQLQRIVDRGINLTVAVDRVAASGGYMMACVANKIIAAPFAVIGSVGVVASIPNFNRLLEKYDIDYEQYTAGEYKRTVTLFGKNSEQAKQKFQEEINETHSLFKDFVSQYRKEADIEKIATGEHWYGMQALDRKLIDIIQTSDDYLLSQKDSAELYEIYYESKVSLADKVADFFHATLSKIFSSKNF